MSKIIKVIFFAVLGIILIFSGLILWIVYAKPNIKSPVDLKVEITDSRVERGKYLANNVTVCMDCHSKRDWNRFSGPLTEGTFGQGGEEFNQQLGFPGKFFSKNITPYALSNWSDGEIYRAITSGVGKDGRPLFPVMPYLNYRSLSKEDVYSIIAYLRTLKPVKNDVEASVADFPMSIIMHLIPKEARHEEIPDTSNKTAYGKYLTNAAGCIECHSMQEKGKKVSGMEFAGGMNFPLVTGGIVRSANITPDKETGIGNWTETTFVSRFKAYADSSYEAPKVNKGDYNSYMPWIMYAHMKESDLGAIYAYLQSLKPIENKVEKFSMNN
jgi:cytochrome c553